jgi:hypothetical protein
MALEDQAFMDLENVIYIYLYIYIYIYIIIYIYIHKYTLRHIYVHRSVTNITIIGEASPIFQCLEP